MNEKLQEAVALYKKGDKAQAMKLLAEIVRQEPNNSVAWYGLALCLDEPDKKIYCLKKVLSLDPTQQKAQQLLAKLQPEHLAAREIIGGQEPPAQNDQQAGERSQGTQSKSGNTIQPLKSKKQVNNTSKIWIGITTIGLLSIIAICVALGLILNSKPNTLSPQAVSPTLPKLYGQNAKGYLPNITEMPNGFEIRYELEAWGDLDYDSKTTTINGTYASRTFINPSMQPNKVNMVMYFLEVYNDIEDAKDSYQSKLQDFSSGKSIEGEFDEGRYKIGIYDEATRLIYLDETMRKSNVIISIRCMAVLDENTDAETIALWALYYHNLILSKFK